MRRRSFTYEGTQEPTGTRKPLLYGDLYLPDEGVPVRAVVQFVHGMDEHFGRYEPFAEFLTANGIALCGEDHRGHGRSVQTIFGSFSQSGNGWELVLRDLFLLRTKLKKEFPDVPYFLLGHSLGSFLVRSMTAADTEEDPVADGIILSGTAYHEAAMLELGMEICRAVIAKKGRETPMEAFMTASGTLYNLKIPKHKTERDWVCSAPDTQMALQNDPYCGHTPTAGLFYDMFSGLLSVCAGSLLTKKKLSCPVLLISGKDDPVGDYGIGVKKTAALFGRLCPRTETKLYPGARHEVLLETCRETVYADVLAFMDSL